MFNSYKSPYSSPFYLSIFLHKL
ncbi:hypothetical protein PT2222_180113 [Paraburkholderia tropica]